MRVKSVSFAAAIALCTVLVMSGCKSSTPASDATTAQQPASQPASQPAAEPAAAPASSAAAPAATPAATPAPAPAVAPAPAPAPVAEAAPAPMPAAAPAAPAPPPPPKKLTVATGTAIPVTITQQLSAKNANVGDSFSGELAGPVKTSGGATVFPRGASVVGTVVGAKGRGRFKGAGDLAIQITSISGTPVNVGIYEQEAKGKGKRTAGMVGGGGGGALIGGLAGGGKGALIGGLVGAGAGTAAAAFTGNKDIVIPAESVVTFHLAAPVTITVKPKE